MGPKTIEEILHVRSDLDLDKAHEKLLKLGIRIISPLATGLSLAWHKAKSWLRLQSEAGH
jgi:hypothetical protein